MDVTIKFIADQEVCLTDDSSKPIPASSLIPDWYRDADFFTHKVKNEDLIKYHEKGYSIPIGFKSCIPFFDAMTSGYLFPLPCDIEIISTKKGCTIIVSDDSYKPYLQIREKMSGFHVPEGYWENHFHWQTVWGMEAPPGWSLLVTQPMNRFELPYYTPSGIIDSDVATISGRMPFFVKKGYSGVVPKGTPFIQVIPIQRVNWYSEFEMLTPHQQHVRRTMNNTTYRTKDFPFYGAYKKLKWVKKNYN